MRWSEDGATVAFLSDRRDNPIRLDTGVGEMIWDYPYDQVDIYTIDATSKTLRRITNDAAREKSPVPGPDGRLFYISDANGGGRQSTSLVGSSPGAGRVPLRGS